MIERRFSVRILLRSAVARVFNRFEHLLDDLGMEACAVGEGAVTLSGLFAVDPVTALRAEQFKAGGQQGALRFHCGPPGQVRYSPLRRW